MARFDSALNYIFNNLELIKTIFVIVYCRLLFLKDD